MSTITVAVPDEPAMLRLAAATAACAAGFHVIYLVGELGAGKTTWVRGFLSALGVGGRVKSPTFTLVESYDTVCGPAHHFDLYRLVDPEELEFLGLRDFLGSGAAHCSNGPSAARAGCPSPT